MKKIYLFVYLFLASLLVNAQEISRSNIGQNVSKKNPSEIIEIKSNDEDEREIWKQDRSYAIDEFSITSSHFDLADWGIYAADDFELAGETIIDGVLFHGAQMASDGDSYINSINIYFYNDDNGVPDGNPSELESAFAQVIDIPIDSEFVIVNPGELAFLGYKEYYIDIAGFLEEELLLPEGIHWISIVFNFELEENDVDIRWLWTDSNTENLNKPMVIDPTNGAEAGLTTWTKIEDAGFPMTDNAFILFGETESLSTTNFYKENIHLFPNPTSDELFITLDDGLEVKNVTIISMLGKKQQLIIENNKLNLNHLSNGTYVLQLNTNKGLLIKKIIKQ